MDDRQGQLYGIMYANGRRLLKLINGLLDYAKIEGNQYQLHRIPCDAGAILAGVMHGATPLADRKQIELEVGPMAQVQRRRQTEKHLSAPVQLGVVLAEIRWYPCTFTPVRSYRRTSSSA